MDTTDLRGLRIRARGGYERARFWRAAREALAAVALAGASPAWGTDPRVAGGIGAILAIVVATSRARGGAAARATRAGTLAGLVPLTLPLLLHRSGFCCVGSLSCDSLCLLACLGGGVVAGALVGARALAREEPPHVFIGAGGLVALLVGSLGCIVSGASGVLGMAAAVALSAIPIALLPRLAKR